MINFFCSQFNEISPKVMQVLEFAHTLRDSNDSTLQSLSGSLSTRQLLRIAQRAHHFQDKEPFDVVQQACLAK